MYSVIIAFTFVAIFVCCFAHFDVGNVNDIKQQLPPELAKKNLTLADAKNFLKEKCFKVAGEVEGQQAFSAIEDETTNLIDCVTNIVNFTTLQSEIEQMKPLGDLDLVFSKYCKKKPEALNCMESFNKKLIPCLENDEKETSSVVVRIVTALLNFVCYKDGDRIALFIAEKGPECIESKKDQIIQCFNNTLSTYVPTEYNEESVINFIPKLIVGAKQCKDLDALGNCVVRALETCEEITPANIVESIFRFVKNGTVCRNM